MLHPGRPRSALAQRDGGVEQALADPDDPRIGRAQALARAIEDPLLALGDRLVLGAHAGDAEELPALVRLPVAEVVVGAMLRRPDVAVRLAGGRRVVHDVDAQAGV